MLTASLILAAVAAVAAVVAVAAGATAVIYGTDAFCALVWRPSLARLDDTALTRSAGAVHRYGDARLPPIGATSIAAATTSAITAALAGHRAGTALAGAAVVALLAWLAIYLRVSAPINRTLIHAAADAEPAIDARTLQRRWNSVIGIRVALQAVATRPAARDARRARLSRQTPARRPRHTGRRARSRPVRHLNVPDAEPATRASRHPRQPPPSVSQGICSRDGRGVQPPSSVG